MKSIFSNRLKSQLQRILWTTIAWIIVSVSQCCQGLFTLHQFHLTLSGLTGLDLLKGSLLTGTLAGLIGGSALVLLWDNWLRSKTYGRMLFFIFINFTFIYVIISFVTNIFFHSIGSENGLQHSNVIHATIGHLFSLSQLYSYTFWLVITLLTLVAYQVNDKYGPGAFRDLLLGKYFHPRKEERIFMFFDMRSSTTIAEQLGEEKYFSLVRELFSDATDPIIYSQGEIYQYVGDEIVISWKMDKGLEQANCINCFFEIQQKYSQKKAKYLKKYGILPEFKAGLHFGQVMAGEVGVVKRDIAFSGDVLNTAARIQGKCNELGVDILLSKPLFDKLNLSANLFNPKNMGNMLLRGKKKKLTLYTV